MYLLYEKRWLSCLLCVLRSASCHIISRIAQILESLRCSFWFEAVSLWFTATSSTISSTGWRGLIMLAFLLREPLLFVEGTYSPVFTFFMLSVSVMLPVSKLPRLGSSTAILPLWILILPGSVDGLLWESLSLSLSTLGIFLVWPLSEARSLTDGILIRSPEASWATLYRVLRFS